MNYELSPYSLPTTRVFLDFFLCLNFLLQSGETQLPLSLMYKLIYSVVCMYLISHLHGLFTAVKLPAPSPTLSPPHLIPWLWMGLLPLDRSPATPLGPDTPL